MKHGLVFLAMAFLSTQCTTPHPDTDTCIRTVQKYSMVHGALVLTFIARGAKGRGPVVT